MVWRWIGIGFHKYRQGLQRLGPVFLAGGDCLGNLFAHASKLGEALRQLIVADRYSVLVLFQQSSLFP